MKTLRRVVAVGLLVGSYHVGMAQSNSIPKFDSDAEKQAWINANPEAYAEMNGSVKAVSAEEKQAWIEANPAEYKANMKVVSSQLTTGAKINAVVPVKEERFASEAEKKAWLDANSKKK
ncbi:MAG: hypothetical protein K9J17_10825 [Flavobacteriales bacterium]|nr:hypothetical protein [Flavobacteriales bacterium]